MSKNLSKIAHLTESFLSAVVGVITDENGFILYLNDEYAQLLGVTPTEAEGQYCCDIIPGSRMHIVAQTGRPEPGVAFRLKNGEYSLCNRLPIKENDRVVAVICFVLFTPLLSPVATTDALINRLRDELALCKTDLGRLRGSKYSIDQIIGKAPAIQKIKDALFNIAQTKSTVLISGETGTGKELFAHAIHQLGPRSQHSLVLVNCAAIPTELFESELFGYEEGSFSGARKGGKVGKFEYANGGTLVLDEIDQLPATMQPKLLRVLQEKEIERVGSNCPISIDARMIFITNKNLPELVRKGLFREDLFFRINIVPVEIPPLRERLEDLPALVDCLIRRINRNLGLNISGLEPEVFELFRRHQWPGNVRELEHLLERAGNMVLSGSLGLDHFQSLQSRLQSPGPYSTDVKSLTATRRSVEQERIAEVLRQTDGNVSHACALLHVSRSVLYEKIKRYNIPVVRPPSP